MLTKHPALSTPQPLSWAKPWALSVPTPLINSNCWDATLQASEAQPDGRNWSNLKTRSWHSFPHILRVCRGDWSNHICMTLIQKDNKKGGEFWAKFLRKIGEQERVWTFPSVIIKQCKLGVSYLRCVEEAHLFCWSRNCVRWTLSHSIVKNRRQLWRNYSIFFP